MTAIVQPIEHVVAVVAPRIRRDAEAVLMAALWRDLQAVAIIEDTAPGEDGCSIGSGHHLAQAAGHRPGTVGVKVAVSRILRDYLEEAPDDHDLAITAATVQVEKVAVHEIAHALVAPLDDDLDDDQALARVMRAERDGNERSPERTMGGHPARWAACYLVVAGRWAGLRSELNRDLRRRTVVRDVENYGHDAAAIEAAIGVVPADVPLRELFAPGSEVATRIAAAQRPEATRLDIIRTSFFADPTAEPLVAAMAAGVKMKGFS